MLIVQVKCFLLQSLIVMFIGKFVRFNSTNGANEVAIDP